MRNVWRLVVSLLAPKRRRKVSLIALLFALLLLVFQTVRRTAPVLNFEPVYDALDFGLTKDESGVTFCPVCFGKNESLCKGILESRVKLRTKKGKWTPRAQGTWNGKPISIKHFGNASEFYRLDNELCSQIGKINAPCEVQDVVWKSFLHTSSIESALQETMFCPSKRLMARVKQLYSGNSTENVADIGRVYLASTLHVNQEPIIFQVFPAKNGWPFPTFYGACGRTIVTDDTGVPLDSLLSVPWIERARLALEVIKIAKHLTNNPEHWGLYLAEIALDNFSVTVDRTVRLVDASHILVVDLLDSNISAETKKTIHQCEDTVQDCLSFYPVELCQGTIRDHNYYAVCRNLLTDRGSQKGLLHTPPEDGEFKVSLDDALTECVSSRTIRRKEAIDLIVGLLQAKHL